MLKIILSANCHLLYGHTLYFCRMMKFRLSYLLLLITITSCNEQDQKKQNDVLSVQTSAREEILKESILKFPDSLLLKEQLIQFYRDSADYDKAIAAADELLQKDSLNDRLWEIKSTLYFENDDTVNAIKALNTAADINPLPKYIVPLGSMYALTKNPLALDIADFIMEAKMTENGKEAFFIKGLYYSYTGDKNKAIGFFDKCLNLDYNFMYAYREKGIALYDMAKYEDAITVLDKAVTLQNKFDEGYYWLGRCLEKLNKPTEAIEEYKTAIRYNPDYVEAKEALIRLGAP